MTVDEIMSMWYGINIQFAVNAMPHQTKIKRKPRGVGAEAKAAAGSKRIDRKFKVLKLEDRYEDIINI